MELLQDYLFLVSLLLGYGVTLSAILLFISKWTKPSASALVWTLLGNLKWLGLTIGVIAVWFWIEKWLLPIHDNQYGMYAFSNRAFGAYAYGVWLPLAFSLLSTFMVLISKTRRYLLSWLLIGIVGFGPILYDLWFSLIIQKNSEFLSAKYTVELPSYVQIAATAISAGFVCLFIISMPILWRFIHKRLNNT